MSNKEFSNVSLKDLQTINKEKIELTVELKQRNKNALEKGRILPDQAPDYIGNFYTCSAIDQTKRSSLHEGIFEVYIEDINGGDLKVRIEDCLGTATAEGKISPDYIEFIKRYQRDTSSVECSKRDLVYRGSSDKTEKGTHYSGWWSYADQNYPSGVFYVSTEVTT